MKQILSSEHFEGVQTARSKIYGFQLSEMIYPPNVEFASHSHEHANFCIALSGGCSETYGKRIRDYKPLTYAFLPANEGHSLKVLPTGMSAFCVEISPPWIDRAREYSLILDKSVHSTRDEISLLLTKLYTEFKRNDSASPLAIEGLALELLAEVSRNQVFFKDPKPPRWLETVKEILHERSLDHFYIRDLSKEVGIHPVHLARKFRKYYRCSIGEYIRKLRVEYACRELSKSEANLLDIALKSGFSDQSHFIRVFKRYLGITPAKYQMKFRKR